MGLLWPVDGRAMARCKIRLKTRLPTRSAAHAPGFPLVRGLSAAKTAGKPSQLGGAKYWRVYAPALLAKRNAIKPSSIRRSTGGAAKIASCDEDSLAGQS